MKVYLTDRWDKGTFGETIDQIEQFAFITPSADSSSLLCRDAVVCHTSWRCASKPCRWLEERNKKVLRRRTTAWCLDYIMPSEAHSWMTRHGRCRSIFIQPGCWSTLGKPFHAICAILWHGRWALTAWRPSNAVTSRNCESNSGAWVQAGHGRSGVGADAHLPRAFALGALGWRAREQSSQEHHESPWGKRTLKKTTWARETKNEGRAKCSRLCALSVVADVATRSFFFGKIERFAPRGPFFCRVSRVPVMRGCLLRVWLAHVKVVSTATTTLGVWSPR